MNFDLEVWLARIKSSGVMEMLSAAAQWVSQQLLEFPAAGPGLLQAAIDTVIRDMVVDRTIYAAQDLFALPGLAIVFFGVIAVIYFGFRLFYVFAVEGFEWALIFLSVVTLSFGKFFGWKVGLVALPPNVIFIYFVVSRWSFVRKPLILQLYSLCAVLLGYLLLKFPVL